MIAAQDQGDGQIQLHPTDAYAVGTEQASSHRELRMILRVRGPQDFDCLSLHRFRFLEAQCLPSSAPRATRLVTTR